MVRSASGADDVLPGSDGRRAVSCHPAEGHLQASRPRVRPQHPNHTRTASIPTGRSRHARTAAGSSVITRRGATRPSATVSTRTKHLWPASMTRYRSEFSANALAPRAHARSTTCSGSLSLSTGAMAISSSRASPVLSAPGVTLPRRFWRGSQTGRMRTPNRRRPRPEMTMTRACGCTGRSSPERSSRFSPEAAHRLRRHLCRHGMRNLRGARSGAPAPLPRSRVAHDPERAAAPRRHPHPAGSAVTGF